LRIDCDKCGAFEIDPAREGEQCVFCHRGIMRKKEPEKSN